MYHREGTHHGVHPPGYPPAVPMVPYVSCTADWSTWGVGTCHWACHGYPQIITFLGFLWFLEISQIPLGDPKLGSKFGTSLGSSVPVGFRDSNLHSSPGFSLFALLGTFLHFWWISHHILRCHKVLKDMDIWPNEHV